MKPKYLLRLASASMAFHLIGHSFGQANWKKTTDPIKQTVITQMTDHSFPFMGNKRSLADYYEGYGWACSIALFFFALILWLLSDVTDQNKGLLVKLLIALTCCLFVWSMDEFVFFFPFAACTTLLAAILTLLAIFQIRNQSL